MKKVKRKFKNLINQIKSIRISTIYKLVGVLLLIGIIFWMIVTLKKSEKLDEETHTIITGTIINKGTDYIMIADQQKQEYIIHGVKEDDYTIGSKVNTNANQIKEKGNKETPTVIESNSIQVIEEKKENKNSDKEVLDFVEDTNKMLSRENLREDAKNNFITIVDFLFYNGKIKGYTINDISTKTKLKVLKITLSIDTKIENFFPGYKESISKSSTKIYTSIKEKVVEKYLELATKVCNYDKDLCASAKEDFQEMKKAFSISWNMIKNFVSNNADKLRQWYEIYSGKTE